MTSFGRVRPAPKWLVPLHFSFALVLDLARENLVYPQRVNAAYSPLFLSCPYSLCSCVLDAFVLSLAAQVLQYRKAVTRFQAMTSDRAKSQVENSLQIDLLKCIAGSQRGVASTRNDRAVILDIIKRLETIQKSNATDGRGTVEGSDERVEAGGTKAAKDTTAVIATETLIEDGSVEGQWLLEYVSNSENGANSWDIADSANPDKIGQVSENIKIQYRDRHACLHSKYTAPVCPNFPTTKSKSVCHDA